MDSTIAELRFDGLRYGRWLTASFRKSVDDLCSAVQLSIVRPGSGAEFRMTKNTVAELLMEDDVVATVRADKVRRRESAHQHGIAITARSLGRELVDCQYSKTMSGLKLGDIIKRLCDEFKVPVRIEAETTVVADFSMQCESPSNALINAVRAANLLLYPTPDGGLLLTKPSEAAPVATLEYGVNFTEYEVVDEFNMVFSEYVIKGYSYGDNKAPAGRVKDGTFDFFRPMHIVADRHGQGLGGCDRRAQWEYDRRLARAHSIVIEVPGWRYRTESGVYVPWDINTQVRVIIPEEEIDDVFLIGDLDARFDGKGGEGSGDMVSLTVMKREAFLGAAAKKKQKKGAGMKKKATR